MSKGSKNNAKNRVKGVTFSDKNGTIVVPAILMTSEGKITVMENAATQEILMKDGSPLLWSEAIPVTGG